MGSDALVDIKLCLYSPIATCVALSVFLYICVCNFITTRMICRGMTWSEGSDSQPSSWEESRFYLGFSALGSALRCIGRTAELGRWSSVAQWSDASRRACSVTLFCLSNNSDVEVIGSLLLIHCVSPTCLLLVSLCRRDKFVA
jgi:hypothetical protein